MMAFTSVSRLSVILLVATTQLVVALPLSAQILPWEVTVAEVEAGRLRNLAQRLNKQNVLYHLRVGDVTKDDLVKTAGQIDQIITSLEDGIPARSIPAPWTNALREQVGKVDDAWSPIRSIAIASPYEHLRVAREFLPRESRRGDPLLLKYFDRLSAALVEESDRLVDHYNEECEKTGIEICSTARTAGHAAMLIERSAKEAVYVVADIDAKANRKKLAETIEAYRQVQKTNTASKFFQEALDPNRGISAKAAAELRGSLMNDWTVVQEQLLILKAGDESNFDLRLLLDAQERMVNKVERLTAALIRYANFAYGS